MESLARRAIGILVSICMCVGMAFPVWAADSQGAADPDETVRVAVINYPNFIQEGEDGVISGSAYEYLEKIQDITGWKYDFQVMDFSDAMVAIEQGTIDLVPGNQYTDERAEKMDYSSSPMGEGGSVLCILPENQEYSYNDYASYSGMKIAALAGSVRTKQAEAKLAQYGTKADFIEYDSDEESKEALEKGEVDAILMSSIRCESRFKILARLDLADLYFCTNKKRPNLKTELDQAMDAIQLGNPYYEEELDKKYYGSIPIQLSFNKEEKTYIETADPIVVAISDDLAPIEYYDKKSKSYRGLVPDTFDLIGKTTGLKFQFETRENMETTKKKIIAGEIQVLGSVADRPGLAETWSVTLTDSYRENSVSAVINAGQKEYNNTEATMVIRRGYPYLEAMAAEEGYTNIIHADEFDDCILMVKKKEADITLVPSNCVDVLLNRIPGDKLDSYLMPNSNMDFSMGVAKNADPLLISILNKSIASITNEQKSEMLIQNLNKANEDVSVSQFLSAHKYSVLTFLLALAMILILAMFVIALNRKRSNLRLQSALEKADAASHAKSEFLSRMSHDIRTPMNAIIGLTKLAKEEKKPEMVKNYLENIDTSSGFLLGLINDILDMSKIESGELQLHPEPYEIREFQQAMNTVIKPLLDRKKIQFQVDLKGVAPCILVDKLRFNQIFLNLLSNAAKFTPEGGHVELVSQPLPVKGELHGCRYYVRDDGVGIGKAFLPHLFEAFSQENAHSDTKEGGTGLGLSIVKNLVDAMGGTIQVSSEPGKGTEFVVELYTPVAESEKGETRDEEDFRCLRGANILLVEDNDLNVVVAKKLLEKEGCQVTVAKDGQQAVDAFEQSEINHYAAVLMDVRMPVMNGLDATKNIRALSRSDAGRVPIIAMTAEAFEEEQKKTIAAGMDYHMSKPINPHQMYQVLAHYIQEKSVPIE